MFSLFIFNFIFVLFYQIIKLFLCLSNDMTSYMVKSMAKVVELFSSLTWPFSLQITKKWQLQTNTKCAGSVKVSWRVGTWCYWYSIPVAMLLECTAHACTYLARYRYTGTCMYVLYIWSTGTGSKQCCCDAYACHVCEHVSVLMMSPSVCVHGSVGVYVYTIPVWSERV